MGEMLLVESIAKELNPQEKACLSSVHFLLEGNIKLSHLTKFFTAPCLLNSLVHRNLLRENYDGLTPIGAKVFTIIHRITEREPLVNESGNDVGLELSIHG